MTAEGRIRSMVCPGFDAMPIVAQLQQFSALTLSREVWRPQSGGGGGGSGRRQATGKRKRGAAAPSFDMSGKCREWCTKGSCRFTDKGGSCSFEPHLPQDKGAAKGLTNPLTRYAMTDRMAMINLPDAGSDTDSVDGPTAREECLRAMAREARARRSGQGGGGGKGQRGPDKR